MANQLLSRKLKSFLNDYAVSETGATAIEYALIAGLIAVVLIGSLTTIGQEISSQFLDVIASALSGGTP